MKIGVEKSAGSEVCNLGDLRTLNAIAATVPRYRRTLALSA
jgi:hypothetical protein